MTPGSRIALVVVLGLLVPWRPAGAQQWSLEARAGRLDFEMDGTVPAATSLGLALARESRTGWFQLATGVPLGEEDPVWGSVSVGGRAVLLDAGPLTLGADAGGQAYLQRYSSQLEQTSDLPFGRVVGEGTTWGRGLAARVLPAAAVEVGRVALEGRAGVSWYRSALADRDRARTVPIGDLNLAVRAARDVSVAAEARRYLAPGGDLTFGGFSGILARPEIRLWGSIGRWFADSVDAVSWSAGAALPLAERLELTVAGREDPVDPLYGGAPRRAWSTGFRFALTDPPAAAEPVPAEYRNGRATIVLPVQNVQGRPRIAGDFTGWEPRPMERAGDRWQFTTALDPGVYEYAFVSPDGEWFVPESVPGRKDDGMGGEVALLVVEGTEP